MPTNKNAMVRYQILDELFQNRQKPLPIQRILEIVNSRIEDMTEQGQKPQTIGLRALQKDIKFMRDKDPWFAPIIQVEIIDDDPEHGTQVIRHGYCYEESGFSIFHKDLTSDEKQLLKAALAVIGQFDGIPQLKGLKRLVDSTNGVTFNQIVSIESNPSDNTTLLGELYLTIADKCSVNLYYHTYSEPDNIRSIGFYPYLLKQYNRRWFLIGAAAKDGKILTFCLDRIDNIERTPSRQYVNPTEDLSERFEEIIGVTYFEEEELLEIIIWVGDKSKDYITSKPIHPSQTRLWNVEEELRAKYTMLHGGAFYRLEVRYNYELIRELCSFGSDLVVLSPKRIQDAVIERISNMSKIYEAARI